MGFLTNLAARAAAARGCAIVRVESVKTCAMVKAEGARSFTIGGVKAAQLQFQLGRMRLLNKMMQARQAYAEKVSRARYDKTMSEIESILEKKDYELRLVEYENWRYDQAEIAARDIFKRMQQLGMIDPKLDFPIPLREGLYDLKPSPLPVKSIVQHYSEFLQNSHEVVGLFTSTINLVVKPVYSVASLFSAIAIVAAVHEEMQTPGSIGKHIRVMSIIIKGEQPTAAIVEGKVDSSDSEET